MKRINLIYSSIFAFATVSAFAQINQTPIHSGGNQIFASAEKELSATGSIFIDEKFLPAKVTGNDATVLARYDAFNDIFQISNPQAQTVENLAKDGDTKITFVNNSKTYVATEYKTEDNQTVNGYLNLVSDDAKVKIYRRERIYLQEGKQSRNSYQAAKAPKYTRANDEFYAKIGSSSVAVYFDGKKDFAKLVPGKEKEVLDYIKQNKLDLEKDADLQKLAAHVNTLI